MGARQYLQQIRRLDEAITVRQSQLDDLMTKRVGVRGISYDEVKVQTSPSGEDPNNRITEKIVDMAREVDEIIDRYVDTKQHIVSQIEQMNDRRFSAILAMRYAQYLSFEVIAERLYYEYDTVRHYHLQALKAFEQQFAEEIAAFDRNYPHLSIFFGK